MKKCLVTAHLSFQIGLATLAYGQNVDQQIIATAGDDIANGNTSVSWTLGQLVGTASVNSGILLTEGFHQSDPITVLSSLPDVEQTITIFPNPAVDRISIDASINAGLGSYQLANLEGRIMESAQEVDFSTTQQIPMHTYADGIYLLTINIEGKEPKQFKIIKKQ